MLPSVTFKPIFTKRSIIIMVHRINGQAIHLMKTILDQKHVKTDAAFQSKQKCATIKADHNPLR